MADSRMSKVTGAEEARRRSVDVHHLVRLSTALSGVEASRSTWDSRGPYPGRTRSRERRVRIRVAVLAWIATALCGASGLAAQELTPRAYWPAPEGVKVVILGYSRVNGDVLFDSSGPVHGVESRVRTTVLGYLQTFRLLGRTANVVGELPYSWGSSKGFVGEAPVRGSLSGFGDLDVTLGVNLLGAPSMTPMEFQSLRARPRTILGASLKVVAPTGQYDESRLLNVGGHRWATRVELGYMIPLRPRWLLELDAGGWFFGDDGEFVAGKREQEPILEIQGHLVRRFRPGFWASLDANYFRGGRQTIGGNRLGGVDDNSRAGGMVVLPFGGRHAVKVGYFVPLHTESGGDYSQLLASYQVLFR
jgi:hypothetical protein